MYRDMHPGHADKRRRPHPETDAHEKLLDAHCATIATIQFHFTPRHRWSAASRMYLSTKCAHHRSILFLIVLFAIIQIGGNMFCIIIA